MPATVAATLAFYLPLAFLSELISIVCLAVDIAMMLNFIIGAVSSVMTAGAGGFASLLLKILTDFVVGLTVSLFVPSITDSIKMISNAVSKQVGCIYELDFFAGASILF